MRPLKLEMEGFTAFRDRTEIDFSKLDLFAITGPTGAGKSSIIDAVCYALYGRVPRVNNEVKSCISLGRDRMQVTLDFSVGLRQYRVIREAKLRPGAAAIALYQHDDEDWEPVAGGATNVNRAVERIVGLDFEGFTRSVLLPQGQFQEFLAGSPDRRRDVLKRLLRLEVYERMRQRASGEASSKRGQVESIDRQLREDLADATPETLAARERRLEEAEREAERLASEAEALEKGQQLLITLNDVRSERTKAEQEVQETRGQIEAANKIAAEGGGALAILKKQHDAVKTALDANTYDDQLFAALTAGVNLALELQRVERDQLRQEKEQATAAAEADRLQKTVAAAIERSEAAGAALEAAKAAFEEAQRHDLAAALQSGLKPGDDCPVCGGKVGKLAVSSTGRITDAKAALDSAETDERRARAAVQEAETRAVQVLERLNGFRASLNSMEDRARDLSSRLKSALPNVKDTSVEALQKELDEQKTQRARRQQLTGDESRLGNEIRRLETELAGAKARLEALTSRLEAAEAASSKAKQAEKEAHDGAVAAAEAAGWSEILAVIKGGGDALPALRTSLGAARAGQHRTSVEEGSLREQVKQIEADIARAERLRKELSEAKGEHDVAADLAQMLRADRFQAFLQSEALRSLAEAGSRRLLDLSDGRYELAVANGGQDFEVVDRWNADDHRSVRTLSGGETFLASLALSLALADSMPGLAPDRRVTLESIFLDEGFGSLDPEALMLARQALESLSLGERFVCVVTHLAEFAEALPARIHVIKSQSGSTVQLS